MDTSPLEAVSGKAILSGFSISSSSIPQHLSLSLLLSVAAAEYGCTVGIQGQRSDWLRFLRNDDMNIETLERAGIHNPMARPPCTNRRHMARTIRAGPSRRNSGASGSTSGLSDKSTTGCGSKASLGASFASICMVGKFLLLMRFDDVDDRPISTVRIIGCTYELRNHTSSSVYASVPCGSHWITVLLRSGPLCADPWLVTSEMILD